MTVGELAEALASGMSASDSRLIRQVFRLSDSLTTAEAIRHDVFSRGNWEGRELTALEDAVRTAMALWDQRYWAGVIVERQAFHQRLVQYREEYGQPDRGTALNEEEAKGTGLNEEEARVLAQVLYREVGGDTCNRFMARLGVPRTALRDGWQSLAQALVGLDDSAIRDDVLDERRRFMGAASRPKPEEPKTIWDHLLDT
jgi:hypothetical protein